MFLWLLRWGGGCKFLHSPRSSTAQQKAAGVFSFYGSRTTPAQRMPNKIARQTHTRREVGQMPKGNVNGMKAGHVPFMSMPFLANRAHLAFSGYQGVTLGSGSKPARPWLRRVMKFYWPAEILPRAKLLKTGSSKRSFLPSPF